MSYTYDYPRPALTVDGLIFRTSSEIEILLIKRKFEPFKNCWALPGGFVDMDEDLVDAAHREIEEETGLTNLKFQQLQTFGKPGRDPRGRVISVVFWAKCHDQANIMAGDDAKEAQWFAVLKLPKLAFDHEEILKVAFEEIPEFKNSI